MSEIAPRSPSPMRPASGLMARFRDCDHGPRHALRGAISRRYAVRHARAAGGAVVTSLPMPVPSAESGADAGSKTNARSLTYPSPLMSPLTMGVYLRPDDRRPNASTRNQRGMVIDPRT